MARSRPVIWLALLLIALCAAPFMVEHYRAQMTDGRRGSAQGQFAELSQGVTHYHLSGPKDGPLIVCVHGLTSPSTVWNPLTRAFAKAGYRTLVYDLYGRGFSGRPAGIQDKAFFNRQLDNLLTYLEIDDEFYLIGYSMGGAIATGFSAQYPVRVRRLALIAPAGMTPPQSRAVRYIRDGGLVGTWLMLARYPRLLRKGIKAELAAGQVGPQIAESQLSQLDFRGFVPAIQASLQGILRAPMEAEHTALRRYGLPALALWGADDTVISSAAMGQLAVWNRDIAHEVIAGAGHGLPYSHTEDVLEHILAFLPPANADDWGRDT